MLFFSLVLVFLYCFFFGISLTPLLRNIKLFLEELFSKGENSQFHRLNFGLLFSSVRLTKGKPESLKAKEKRLRNATATKLTKEESNEIRRLLRKLKKKQQQQRFRWQLLRAFVEFLVFFTVVYFSKDILGLLEFLYAYPDSDPGSDLKKTAPQDAEEGVGKGTNPRPEDVLAICSAAVVFIILFEIVKWRLGG